MVTYCSEWLGWLDEARTFDAVNTGDTISVSQFGSGCWLQLTNDFKSNIRHSKVPSAEMRATMQYRNGASTASASTDALDEKERRSVAVMQADRLGDTAVHTVGTTMRHNRFNRCAFEALAAVATGAVLLGDRGDGSPRASAEAVRRNGHYNADHCPDIIEPDDPDRLYELRLYTPFRAGAGAAGLGSSRCGGKPSCRAGDTHAFGCTREDIRRTALGCAEHGVEADGPFDHATGKGYVAPHKGQYADALSKGRQVWLLVAEVTGALDATVAALLPLLGSRAKVKGHRDGTVYGRAWRHATSRRPTCVCSLLPSRPPSASPCGAPPPPPRPALEDDPHSVAPTAMRCTGACA